MVLSWYRGGGWSIIVQLSHPTTHSPPMWDFRIWQDSHHFLRFSNLARDLSKMDSSWTQIPAYDTYQMMAHAYRGSPCGVTIWGSLGGDLGIKFSGHHGDQEGSPWGSLVFISSDRSSYSDVVLLDVQFFFQILTQSFWYNWCYKCHSKSLKQYQCNWCHRISWG